MEIGQSNHERLAGAPVRRLSDAPDWRYLLQEFDTFYSSCSAGGSKVIRSHQDRVREALAGVIAADAPMLAREPASKPVVAHLPRALDLGRCGAMAGMSRVLSRLEKQLSWEYGYKQVPLSLERNYAYCEILGPQGPIQSDGLILGFVLFAPGTTYPEHNHAGIEESYVSMAGAWSENDSAVYMPGSLIYNPPGYEHRITTGERDPCLLAYAWIGPAERLAQPMMVFS